MSIDLQITIGIKDCIINGINRSLKVLEFLVVSVLVTLIKMIQLNDYMAI